MYSKVFYFISYWGKKERKKCSFFRIFEKYVGIVPLFLFMIHGCNTSCVWKRNAGYLKGLLLSYDWNRMHANIIEVVCTYLCKILFPTLSRYTFKKITIPSAYMLGGLIKNKFRNNAFWNLFTYYYIQTYECERMVIFSHIAKKTTEKRFSLFKKGPFCR